MFRNAQHRLDLRATLPTLLPAQISEENLVEGSGNVALLEDGTPRTGYAEGSQKKNVSGEVIRWDNKAQVVCSHDRYW